MNKTELQVRQLAYYNKIQQFSIQYRDNPIEQHPLLDLSSLFSITDSNSSLYANNYIYLFSRHSKDNQLNNVLPLLLEKYGNSTKLTPIFTIIEIEKGFLTINPLVNSPLLGLKTLGTNIKYFANKEEVKDFIENSPEFYNKNYYKISSIALALKNLEKVSLTHNDTSIFKTVLHKIKKRKF